MDFSQLTTPSLYQPKYSLLLNYLSATVSIFNSLWHALINIKKGSFGHNPVYTTASIFSFNGSFFHEPRMVKCGVPQGSCLGPLIFSVFIMDVPLVLDKANLTTFADDTTVCV